MAFNIGINVLEVEGSAAPALAGAPTSVTGLILRSRRGPTDRAVRVSNFRQFVSRFGGHRAAFAGAYCVDGFFLNGGREAYVARILGSNSEAASVTLEDRTGTDTLTVRAGYRGIEEAGEWGNELYVDVADNPEVSTLLTTDLTGNTPARLQGTDLGSPVDLSAASTLTLAVDAASPVDVILDGSTLPVPTAATAQDVVEAIQAQAGQLVVASVSGGGILLVSRSKGSTSSVGASGSAQPVLLLPAVAATGTDGTGPAEAQVDSLAGFQIGDRVRLDDGITQNWHVVTELVEQNGTYIVRWTPPGATDQNEYRIADGATLSTCEFDLIVRRLSPADPEPQTVETWEKLTLDSARSNYAVTKVNEAFTGSSHIVLADLNASTFNGSDVPAIGRGFRLGLPTPTTSGLTRVPGADGDPPSTADYTAALSRFDTIAIQLLAVPALMPDGMLRAVTRAAIDYSASKGDCMFAGYTPAGYDVAGAKAFGRNFRAAKVYGALYWPWITVTDPTGSGSNPTKAIPPIGHVLGTYARIDQTRGVWKAPAGNEAVLRGALAVESDITDTDHTDLVKNGSVNGIRQIRGTGIAIDAARTLSTDTRWLYVNVRLLFNYVKASLREGLRWVKQEPNRETLWNKIKFNTVTPFLQRLYQAGAFGPGTPDEVFTVICGAENNPPDQVVLGNLQVEIYFYPARPAETIIILVGQQESGATASEQ